MGAHHQRLRGIYPWPLGRRDIERIRLAHRQGRLLHVAHDADDRGPRQLCMSGVGADANPLTDWILMGKFALRKRLTDYHHSGRVCVVALVEKAAAPQRNTRGFEVARAHGIAEGAFGGGGLRLELHTVYIEISAQGQLASKPRGSDSTHLAHCFQGLGKKAGTSAVGVELMTVLLHLHGEQVRGVESRIDGKELLETAQDQSRGHEQHQGERDLRDRERTAG